MSRTSRQDFFEKDEEKNSSLELTEHPHILEKTMDIQAVIKQIQSKE